jgi:cell division transport system permease protein
MEVFLGDELDSVQSTKVRDRIHSIRGVQETIFISKDEAARIFKKEFGEDINTVLDFNPLPASFKIKFMPEYRNSDSAKMMYTIISSIEGVDDVVYRKTLLEILDRRVKIFFGASAAIGITLLIAAIFLVSNTIRLTIYAKRKMINTMKLVGATRSFIKRPFLIEGMLHGLLGGALSAGLIWGITYIAKNFISHDLSEFFSVEIYYYGILVASGILLGLLGSSWSVKRFISEKIISS